MKKFITLLMVLCSSPAFAGSMFDGMSDDQLERYEILVVDKTTGKTIGSMSRATHKVVSLDSSAPAVPGPSPAQVEQTRADKAIADTYRGGYNTVILHAGTGKDGLDYHHDGDYEVKEKDAMVGGLTACRSWSGTGVCASGFTNKTFTLGLKFDFK